jgi:4-hydroxy-tetrahydrodipicolinate synthase
MSITPRRLLAVMTLFVGFSVARAGAEEPGASTHTWAGIYPTLVTPYRGPNGGIDTAALERQVDHVLRGRVQGLVILDFYGEGEFVSPQEREEVIQTTIRCAFPRLPVIVGIQGTDLAEARQQLLHARDSGASAVLVQYLAHGPITEGQLYGFMRGLAELHALPIFYDQCPEHSGVSLTAMQVAHILALPGIAGIREGTMNINELEEHQRLCRGMHKAFFSSTALNLTQFLSAGGQGAMCPEAVLLPGPSVKAYHAFAAGRREEARSIQEELFTLTPIFRHHETAPVLQRVAYVVSPDSRQLPSNQQQPQAQMKAALNCMGVSMQALVKLQLPELTHDDLQDVKATVGSVQKIDWCEVELRVPPQPQPVQASSRVGGMLLRTGAFQLGPGVGKDLTRSQGDGLGGFFP